MKVEDIMTRDVITVRADTPVREVAQVLATHHISGAPVCDAAGHLVGLVTEYDLIAKPHAQTAQEAMTRNVISVMEDTSLDEVRYLLVERKIKRVPVLRGPQLVGIVSRADLVRELALAWVCRVCGQPLRDDAPPARCPTCGAPEAFHPTAAPAVAED
jgi:CBS domain-containing protein